MEKYSYERSDVRDLIAKVGFGQEVFHNKNEDIANSNWFCIMSDMKCGKEWIQTMFDQSNNSLAWITYTCVWWFPAWYKLSSSIR